MIWTELEHKGRIATIIGVFFSLPYNIKFVIDSFIGFTFSYDMLYTMIVVNVIGMLWLMLPSALIISGKGFNLEVKD